MKIRSISRFAIWLCAAVVAALAATRAQAAPIPTIPMPACLRSALAATIAGLLFLISGAASAAVITQSDATWKVTPANPGAVPWNSSTAFDDSGWQNATVPYDVGAVTLNPAYAGTKGIWSAGGQFSTTEVQVWARHTFSLPGALSSAQLTVGCDDDCQVWVNGMLVINDQNGSANNSGADILALLTPGTNLIALTATDNWPVWGFNHSTWVQLDGTVASTSVPEPSALALLALALGLGATFRRRKPH